MGGAFTPVHSCMLLDSTWGRRRPRRQRIAASSEGRGGPKACGFAEQMACFAWAPLLRLGARVEVLDCVSQACTDWPEASNPDSISTVCPRLVQIAPLILCAICLVDAILLPWVSLGCVPGFS